MVRAGVTKVVMVMDKDTVVMADMKDMEVVVMITMAVMADTEVMTTPVMETTVNTRLTIPTIIHKRVIIISKTNNSKNFIIFFLSHNQFFVGTKMLGTVSKECAWV